MKRNKSRLTVQLDGRASALVKRIQRKIARRESMIVPASPVIACALEIFELTLVQFYRDEDRNGPARP
jgi:hypothetical protein